MTRSEEHPITVACISVAGGRALEQCVQSALRTGFRCMAVIGPGGAEDALRDVDPDRELRIIASDHESIPQKRALAVAQAQTEWIALVEDTCTLDESWRDGCEELIRYPAVQAASGPVRLSRIPGPALRALYCADYGAFFPHVLTRNAGTGSSGALLPARELPGVNLLYRRDAAQDHMADGRLIETEVNRGIRSRANGLYLHPDLSVTLRAEHSRAATMGSRFAQGRLYGGLQSRQLRAATRAFRAVACLLLPFVLTYRAVRALSGLPGSKLRTGMYIVLFETAWSCGELTGYLFGPGNAADQWR